MSGSGSLRPLGLWACGALLAGCLGGEAENMQGQSVLAGQPHDTPRDASPDLLSGHDGGEQADAGDEGRPWVRDVARPGDAEAAEPDLGWPDAGSRADLGPSLDLGTPPLRDAGEPLEQDAGSSVPVRERCDFEYLQGFRAERILRMPLPQDGARSWPGQGADLPDPASAEYFPISLPAAGILAVKLPCSGCRPEAAIQGDFSVPAQIAHAEPLPPFTYRVSTTGTKDADLTLPGYDDDLPLFERARDWQGGTRCYELPAGATDLTEEAAYDLYRRIAERTTGVALDDSPGVRSVVGLRGAWPGTFAWHGNEPDLFDDTLVLLWRDAQGSKQVIEFPVNTDTGDHDFGEDSSSSLRPNRRYRYSNGWHGSYNALHIAEDGYAVRDDHNHNGHWDSDRNGWLPPSGADHDRTGGGHNIHMASVGAPLARARVDSWSAGCQTIPGTDNWAAFIRQAWTGEGDPVSYFLIDVRDIPAEVWQPCAPDGSHACPYLVEALPYSRRLDTSVEGEAAFDRYSCSAADESGAELVHELRLDRSGTLAVSVDCVPPVDIDIHLLDGDDPRACLARDDTDFEHPVTPGRYLIVADTYVDGQGNVLAGPCTLNVSLR